MPDDLRGATERYARCARASAFPGDGIPVATGHRSYALSTIGSDQRDSGPVILPDGALVLLIGAPGAGKSTLAAALVAAGEVAAEDVLSTDAYREQLSGDALDLTQDRKVWV